MVKLKHTLILLCLVVYSCSTLRTDVLWSEDVINGDITILGVEEETSDTDFIKLKHYLLSTLDSDLEDVLIDSSNVYSSLVDSSLVNHALIVEMRYRDKEHRNFTQVELEDEIQTNLELVSYDVVSCEALTDYCTYDFTYAIPIPNFVLDRFYDDGFLDRLKGFFVRLKTDANEFPYSVFYVKVSYNQINSQMINVLSLFFDLAGLLDMADIVDYSK